MSIALVMSSMPSCHGDAMPLTSSSPSALNLSQHHSLFQWVRCWHQLAKLLNLSLDNSNGAALLHQSAQFSSVAQACPTLCDPVNCSMPGLPVITNSWSSPILKSIESVMPSSHLILCCPLLLLPPIPPSIRKPQPWLDGTSVNQLCWFLCSSAT